MEYLQYFEKVAPHLANPLVLVGFVLLLVLSIHRTLIKSKILQPVSKRASGQLVRLLLHYGFLIALTIIVAGFTFAFWKARVDADRPVLTRIDTEAIVQGNRGNIERCLSKLDDNYHFLDFYISHDQDAGINIDIVPFWKSDGNSGTEHPRIFVDRAKAHEGEVAVRDHLSQSAEQKLSITSPDTNFCIIESLANDVRGFQLPAGSAFIHRYITDSCCGV